MRGCFVLCVSLLAGMAGWSCGAVGPDAFAKNSPTFRGPTGYGVYDKAGQLPLNWSEKDKKNVLWRAKLELSGWASPVVWDNKVIVSSASSEKRLLVCFEASTGKELWKLEPASAEGTAGKYELETQDERWDKRMHAASTPATDGQQVYALFSNGQLVACDLASGKLVWSIVLGDSSGNKFGLASSLLLYADTVIAVFQGEQSFVAAYSVANGAEKWKTARKTPTWASPILVKTGSGKTLIVLPADPDVTAWDADSGKQVWTVNALVGGPDHCVGPSPVLAGGVLVVNCQNCGMHGLDVESGRELWGLKELPDGSSFSYGSSLATDGRHVYQFFESVLTAVDVKDGKVLKQKTLNETDTQASPLISGGNLYLFCVDATLVVKADPVADFPEVGKGLIDEVFEASPAAAGGRIYIRTDGGLLCIGEK